MQVITPIDDKDVQAIQARIHAEVTYAHFYLNNNDLPHIYLTLNELRSIVKQLEAYAVLNT